jgi:hypothetical protein
VNWAWLSRAHARTHVAEMRLLRTCRSVLRELKAASGGGEAGEQWKFIVSAVRQRGTERRDLQEREKAQKTLDSYLTYLQSSRQHRVRSWTPAGSIAEKTT